jgi:manganese/iron transport system substrate-binding protein
MIIMTQSLQTSVASALMALLLGCSNSVPPESSRNPNKLVVVATSSVLCDLTKQVAAETIDLKCLVAAGVDPHVYEPTPEDRQTIERAALVLYSGYNLEPKIEKLVTAAPNRVVKAAVNQLAVTNPLKGESSHEGEAHGESHEEEIDPHVWHDPKNGVKIVGVIRDNLAKVLPAEADKYRENSRQLTQELEKIDGWIAAQIETIPQRSRTLVTTHDALNYYSKAYRLPVAPLSGINTEEKPTAAQVKQTIDLIRSKGVPTIFAESSANPKILENIAKEAKVKLSQKPLFVDGLGEANSGAETYQKMILSNTEAIVVGLGGKFTPLAN